MAEQLKTPMKPDSLEAYYVWAKDNLGHDLSDGHVQRCYELTLTLAQNALQASKFYEQLDTLFKQFAEEYQTENGTDLFMHLQVPDFQTKPYSSAVEKTYRKNVLLNDSWPDKPKGEWISPVNWFNRLNDIVRTIVVCKFIDGPEFVCSRLKKWSDENGETIRFDRQQSDAGYYAYHLYVTLAVDVLVPADNNTNKIEQQAMEVEIQFTTQFQEVLRVLTHTYYEQTRLQVPTELGTWKWDHESDQFRSSYMGHTLHLLEAIILELRNNHRAKEKKHDGNG